MTIYLDKSQQSSFYDQDCVGELDCLHLIVSRAWTLFNVTVILKIGIECLMFIVDFSSSPLYLENNYIMV